MDSFSKYLSNEHLTEISLPSFVGTFVRKISAGIKKLFKLSSYGFGQSQLKKMTVTIPSNLLEGKSVRKLSGSHVESLTCLYLSEMITPMGFEVKLKLDNKPLSNSQMQKHCDDIQKKIKFNQLYELNPSKRSAVNRDVLKTLADRKNFAYASAQRLSQTIEKDTDAYPNMFEVIIDSAGYAGEGSTKADIDITINNTKIVESKVSKNLKKYSISHKYAWDEAMGTQFNSVYTLLYSITTGKTDGRKKQSLTRGVAYKLVKKEFGAKGIANLDRLHYLWGNKNERKTNRGEILDPKAQKEFEKFQTDFYIFVARLLEENYLNLFKFIGIERDVDHFMVVFNKSTNKYDAFSSIDSKKYKTLYEALYDEEFGKESKCRATPSGDVINIDFIWRGNIIYQSSLKVRENSSKKSMNVFQGVSTSDMDDAKTGHDAKFVAKIPDEFAVSRKGRSKGSVKGTNVKTPKDTKVAPKKDDGRKVSPHLLPVGKAKIPSELQTREVYPPAMNAKLETIKTFITTNNIDASKMSPTLQKQIRTDVLTKGLSPSESFGRHGLIEKKKFSMGSLSEWIQSGN